MHGTLEIVGAFLTHGPPRRGSIPLQKIMELVRSSPCYLTSSHIARRTNLVPELVLEPVLELTHLRDVRHVHHSRGPIARVTIHLLEVISVRVAELVAPVDHLRPRVLVSRWAPCYCSCPRE